MLKRVDQPQNSGPDARVEVASSPGPIDFDQLLAAARRQARVVAVASVAALLLGLAYTITAVPLYTATTDILIDSQKDQNALSASIAELTFDTGAIDSQVEVLKSEKIALSVISAMNLTHDPEFMGARGTLIGQAFGLLRSAFDFSGWFMTREKSNAEEDADHNALGDRATPGRSRRASRRPHLCAGRGLHLARSPQGVSDRERFRRGLSHRSTRRQIRCDAARRRLAADPHFGFEATVAGFRFRHPEIQSRQWHRRHGRRPARTYVRSAADRTQRADGACARRHGESRSALRANRGLVEIGSRRRNGPRFARQSGHHRSAREIPDRLEGGSAARKQARQRASPSHQPAKGNGGIPASDSRRSCSGSPRAIAATPKWRAPRSNR